MLTYLSILLAVGIAAFAVMVMPKKYAVPIAVPMYILVWLFMGLREHIGGDWEMYKYFFEIYSTEPFSSAHKLIPTEPGYAYLNWAVGHGTGNLHLLLLILAAIVLTALWRLAKCFEIDPTLALFLACPYMIFVAAMGYNRQSAALGFAFLAICAMREKKTIKFIVFFALAAVFHTSAPGFLIVMWANSWRKAIVAGVAVAFSLLGSVQSVALEKLQGYALSQATTASGVWFRLAIFGFGFLFLWAQRQHWREDPDTYKLLKRSAWVLGILAIFAQTQSTIVDRFGLYFFFGYILMLGRSIQYSSKENRWFSVFLVFSWSFSCFALWFTLSPFARYAWTPYRFAFY